MNRVLVLGASGFIGNHLVRYLTQKGNRVRAVDCRPMQSDPTATNDFVLADLRDPIAMKTVVDQDFDAVYQLAANMGGAGYIFTGNHDADIVSDSALINLNCARICSEMGVKKVFFSSSACVYPLHHQSDLSRIDCSEASAYPANPDSEYGWEKLFSERLFLSYLKNKGLPVRIARFHNVYGEQGTWQGGREKVPAALCRKVALALDGDEIEVWGDGLQTRSFLYIQDCLEAVDLFMNSPFPGPLNIGSEEMISISKLAELIIAISGKKLSVKHIAGPQGVRGRNSSNDLIREKLGWNPRFRLSEGMRRLYEWVLEETQKQTSPTIPTMKEQVSYLS